MKRLFISLVFGAVVSQAAIVYDLESDFSHSLNPNGVWSFVQGSSALPLQSQPTDGNPLNGAAANGYFGVSNNFSTAPFIFETSQDGASTSPYTDNDFLAGDIVAHSANPGGSNLFIEWTAPVAGTITYSGDVWYAHSPVTRSNDYFLTLDGGSNLAAGSVSSGNGMNRADPSTFASSGSIAVSAGDVLALELAPTAGQDFGSLAGVNLTVTLTASAAPEPGTYLLFGAGLLAITALMKRP